jgi:excisionase family DNA binding protein
MTTKTSQNRSDLESMASSIKEFDDLVADLEPVPLTIKQVADRLGVRKRKIKEMVAKGELRSVAVGTEHRIPCNEFKRIGGKMSDKEFGVLLGIAVSIKRGNVKEIGVDKFGVPEYQIVKVVRR